MTSVDKSIACFDFFTSKKVTVETLLELVWLHRLCHRDNILNQLKKNINTNKRIIILRLNFFILHYINIFKECSQNRIL